MTAPTALHQAVESLSPALYRPVGDTRFRAEADFSQPTALRYVEAGMVTMLRAETTGPGIAGTTVDSNADPSGNVNIQTGAPGRNDHTFDIGIYPSPVFPLLGDGPLATFTGSLAIVGLGTGFVLWRRGSRSVAWRAARRPA
ncbi:hypothetical protein ACIRPK_13870 [Kitasatospora sp. NPDC101801]|uniref:hypothetical protein n=1 Tax=Kitasatospora sp. NPDC101801 TaxID=3364103 RepID=UPI003823A6D4